MLVRTFGVEIKEAGDNITVNSSGELKLDGSMIDAANSGTTIQVCSCNLSPF